MEKINITPVANVPATHQVSSLPQTEFDAILNSIPDVIIRVDLSGKIVWWNKNLEDITLFSREKLLTCLLDDLLKSCDGAVSLSSIIDETITKQNAEVDAYLYCAEGNKRYHLKTTLIETNLKKEILIVARDIHERTQMTDALKKSQIELQKLIDSLPFLIFLTSTDNTYILANKNFCDFVGLPSNEIIGFRNEDIFNENIVGYFSRDNNKILSQKCSVHYESVFDFNGNSISLSFDKLPLFDDSDNIYAVCGVVEDVTTQFQLQKQLQQIQKMEAIGQLTGGIAHDFNNVLASIMGYTGLTVKSTIKYNDEIVVGYLAQITRAGERARDLVQQLLAFSRGDVGGLQVLEPEPLAKETIKMLSSVIPSSINLNLNINNINSNHYIEVDPVQFNQSIMNLVINAKDALVSETGNIDVTLDYLDDVEGVCDSCHLSFSGRYIRISVSDSGTGISKEILNRIFDPFFTTKEVGKGSGMGLSMLHGIVHGSGGHIIVKSDETPSKSGTIIQIYFPKVNAKKDQQDIEEITVENIQTINKGQHALVIDDESMITRYLNDLLEGQGYKVTSFNNPIKALSYFNESHHDIDFIITDQTMPGLTGLELAKNILLDGHKKPIILCTGYSDFAKDMDRSQSGIDIFMNKPLDDDLLLNNIDQLLTQYQS